MLSYGFSSGGRWRPLDGGEHPFVKWGQLWGLKLHPVWWRKGSWWFGDGRGSYAAPRNWGEDPRERWFNMKNFSAEIHSLSHLEWELNSSLLFEHGGGKCTKLCGWLASFLVASSRNGWSWVLRWNFLWSFSEGRPWGVWLSFMT